MGRDHRAKPAAACRYHRRAISPARRSCRDPSEPSRPAGPGRPADTRERTCWPDEPPAATCRTSKLEPPSNDPSPSLGHPCSPPSPFCPFTYPALTSGRPRSLATCHVGQPHLFRQSVVDVDDPRVDRGSRLAQHLALIRPRRPLASVDDPHSLGNDDDSPLCDGNRSLRDDYHPPTDGDGVCYGNSELTTEGGLRWRLSTFGWVLGSDRPTEVSLSDGKSSTKIP
jgi:hypothetical protein